MDDMDHQVIEVVIDYGRRLIFENDSDDESGNVLEKVWDFAEETIPRFANHQFRQHFRLTPATFEELLIKIHDAENHDVHSGRPDLPLEKQLMITLWYLSNVESFRSVSVLFGVSKSTSWDILYRICNKILLVNQQNGIIAWPSRNRAREIAQGFEEISQFPGIIGAIDGCHIPILKPKDHPNSYINRKGFASILLQGVCDNKKLFTDVFTGVPGSVHDSRLYRMSDLFNRIENNLVQFPDDTHLIGDLAYVLSEKLLVGFKNNGHLNESQINFNNKLSKARVLIENTYAYLKGRFRRLKMLETIRLDLIALVIITACILHNVCILAGDLPEDFIDINDEIIDEEVEENVDIVHVNLNARAKRNAIMEQLPQN